MPCAAVVTRLPSPGSKQITGRHGYAEAERTVGRTVDGAVVGLLVVCWKWKPEYNSLNVNVT